jgi:O-antigen ligase
MNYNIEYIAFRNKPFLDGLLISLVLFAELCFDGKALFLTPLIFLFRIALIKKLYMDSSYLWLFIMMLYTTVLGMVVPNNSDNFSVWYNWAVFLNLFFICILIFQYTTIQQFMRLLKNIVILSSLLNGVYILSHEYKVIISRLPDYMIGRCGYRLGGNMGINSNNIAWLFGLLALFTIYFFIEEKNWMMLLLYFFQLIIIFFTGSKNGILMAIIPIIYYGIKSLKKLNLMACVLIIVLLVILWNMIQNIPLLYTLIGSRIDQFLFAIGINQMSSNSVIDVSSTLKRMDMIKSAKQMFWEKPIFGWGIGAFAKYSGYGYYCHNNYMELLVSGGIVGFIIYYGYIIRRFLQYLFSHKNKYGDLIYILLISIIIIDMGTVNFYSRISLYLRILVMFVLLVKFKSDKNSSIKEVEYSV